jgi:hypothetical protein
MNREAVKVKNQKLNQWEFQEPVNDWFIKVVCYALTEDNLILMADFIRAIPLRQN